MSQHEAWSADMVRLCASLESGGYFYSDDEGNKFLVSSTPAGLAGAYRNLVVMGYANGWFTK